MAGSKRMMTNRCDVLHLCVWCYTCVTHRCGVSHLCVWRVTPVCVWCVTPVWHIGAMCYTCVCVMLHLCDTEVWCVTPVCVTCYTCVCVMCYTCVTHRCNVSHLCDMPITKLSTPCSLDVSITCFNAGIRTSQPSSPKRFSVDHFLARNCSKLVECRRRFIRVRFSWRVSFMTSGSSKRFLIQLRWSWLSMNMYSRPMCLQ